MKQIVRVPNDVLAHPSDPVTSFDKKLTRLISEMKATLLATTNPKGVGLAAPQIGESVRVFITKPNESANIRVFINPEIISRSDDLTDGVPERENKLEGCLSIPNIWGRVSRAKRLTLSYTDEKGTKKTESFSGFLATIIQHETDHINGVLFTLRVLEQKGTLFQNAKGENGKDELVEVTI